MHIAIDARMYGTRQRGIGRYLMKLIENLEEITPSPQPSTTDGEEGFQYTIFLRKENFEEYQPKNPNFKKVIWNAPWYGWKEQLQCKMQNVKCKMDLWHFPHWNVPLLFRQPFIVTIHDLELFSSNRTRENTTRGHLTYWLKFQAFKIIFRHAVLASYALIVPSNYVREQLLDMYPQVRRKTHVIYEAPTIDKSEIPAWPAGRRNPNDESNSKFYILNSKFVLYVGAAYPHKNLPRLLEAWKLVHTELPDYKLILVGREDFFWKKLKRVWNAPTPPNLPSGRGGNDLISPPWRGGVRGGVMFYGAATDAELSTLYKNAALLVQPSLEEGFSLSPLEALAHGTPVAVSDIPVHREILGSSVATYFNPRDIQDIAKTLSQMLAPSKPVPQLSTLPRTYSWQIHAQKTLELYETVKLR